MPPDGPGRNKQPGLDPALVGAAVVTCYTGEQQRTKQQKGREQEVKEGRQEKAHVQRAVGVEESSRRCHVYSRRSINTQPLLFHVVYAMPTWRHTVDLIKGNCDF